MCIFGGPNKGSTGASRRRSHRPAYNPLPTDSTAGSSAADIGPAGYCCGCSVGTVIISALTFLVVRFCIRIDDECNLDLFVDTIAVSASAASSRGAATSPPAEWRVKFLAKTPLSEPDFSLNMLSARLLRREKPLSTAAMYSFQRWERVGDRPVATTVIFNATAPEAVGDDGTVVWDFRVETVAGLQPDWGTSRGGYLIVRCGDLPVRFWSDPTAAAAIKGSLSGNNKQCEYSFRSELQPWDYPSPDASKKILH